MPVGRCQPRLLDLEYDRAGYRGEARRQAVVGYPRLY